MSDGFDRKHGYEDRDGNIVRCSPSKPLRSMTTSVRFLTSVLAGLRDDSAP